ncbi:MAG: hypothetical protein BGO98_49130 [Myxococcales bacterium 68-20]|nr:MAG: hypothetical protein BGO98_49130 [Myxococcales bacterium 68-20]
MRVGARAKSATAHERNAGRELGIERRVARRLGEHSNRCEFRIPSASKFVTRETIVHGAKRSLRFGRMRRHIELGVHA